MLRDKLTRAIEEKNAILQRIYGADELDVDKIIEEYVEFDQLIDPYVTNTSEYLCNALDDGKHVLAEGAQGSLLDVDFGSYPYVTSSHPTAAAAPGSGCRRRRSTARSALPKHTAPASATDRFPRN